MPPDDLAPGPGESLDRLSRTLLLLQRVRGHRATSDDVLLAAAGALTAPHARRVLDLGTGKGTVALLLARALPASALVGLEAVPESHALAQRNARLNQLDLRYQPRLADLRDPAALAGEAPFDLITGAPPYMPLGTGLLPADPQRAAGRFELRGGIEAYAEVAAAHRSAGGVVVLLLDGRGADRLARAFAAVGLPAHLTAVVPRPGHPPTFQIAATTPGLPPVLPMRLAEGEAWSPAYAAWRNRLDLG